MKQLVDLGIWAAVAVVGLFVGSLLLIGIVLRLSDFLQKLQYLNMEIGRTTGKDRVHWKRRRRRLWLSLFLFGRE